MNTIEKIELMQAYLKGKKIQEKEIGTDIWEDCDDKFALAWDWSRYNYRIKPKEEKPRLMTHRELFEWIIRGKGQQKSICASLISEALKYYEEKAECPVYLLLIKPLGSEEWVEPTVDIYERDCKGEASK